MVKPDEILNADDYKSYRNVRLVIKLYVAIGIVWVLVCLNLLNGGKSPSGTPVDPAVAIGGLVYGILGIIGGIAAHRANRKWGPLVYVVAVLYFFIFPIGPILSYVFLKGFPRYLDGMEKIAQANSATAS